MATPCADSELPSWAKPNKNGRDPAEQDKSNIIAALKKTAFVVGTALLVFASARNTITWHFQHFWGASKYFWENRWNDVYLFFGKDDWLISTVGTTVVTATWFWLVAGLFLFVDVTGRPSFLMRYKIQDAKAVPVSMKDLWKTVKLCLFNQLIVGSILGAILSKIGKWRGGAFTAEELPTFHWVLFEIFVFTLVEEFGFYYSHRLLHHPRIYKYIHKKHHEWTAPICIVGIYAHPLEHCMSNVFPIFLGPLIMGSHIATSWLWFILAYTSTLISHSGWHFPFLPSPEAHDYHHLKFINNFGVLGVLDRLHGTDNLFRRSKCYERHIMLLGLKPLKETYPDDPKKGECKKDD